tara:strand:- start:27430 stop:28002 length:573 start_codon:yes stop_codon:yes gene_type:complete
MVHNRLDHEVWPGRGWASLSETISLQVGALLGADLEGTVIFLLVAVSARGLANEAAERNETAGFGGQRLECRLGRRISQDFRAQAVVRLGCVPVGAQNPVETGEAGLDILAGHVRGQLVRALNALQNLRNLFPTKVQVFERRQGGVRQALPSLRKGAVRGRADIVAQGRAGGVLDKLAGLRATRAGGQAQ